MQLKAWLPQFHIYHPPKEDKHGFMYDINPYVPNEVCEECV